MGAASDEPAWLPGLRDAASSGQRAAAAACLLEWDGMTPRQAQIDAPCGDGFTPLHHAARRGWATIVLRLLEAGADPNAASVARITVLMAAADGGDQTTVAALLAAGAGASLNTTSFRRETALTLACSGGHAAAARLLLEAGAGTGRAGSYGKTALMRAAWADDVDTVRAVLDHCPGADEATEALADYSVGAHARTAPGPGSVAVVRLLLSRGADPYAAVRAVRESSAAPRGFRSPEIGRLLRETCVWLRRRQLVGWRLAVVGR